MSRPTRALNLQIFSLSLCRTHLLALLSRLLTCHTSLTNIIKEQILYRKTTDTVYLKLYKPSSKTAKIKMFINYKHKTYAPAETFKAGG